MVTTDPKTEQVDVLTGRIKALKEGKDDPSTTLQAQQKKMAKQLSKADREDLIAKLQAKLDELKAQIPKPKADLTSLLGTIPTELTRIRPGVFGRLPVERVIVVSVVDQNSAVFSTLFTSEYWSAEGNRPVKRFDSIRREFYISGIDTSPLADGAATTLSDAFYIIGNKRVQNTTYYHLVPFRLTADEADAIKAAMPPPPPPSVPENLPEKPVTVLVADVNITPPKGAAIIMAVNPETLELYEKAVASGNSKVATSMTDRGIVARVTEPLGVKVEYRGSKTVSVRPVTGPLAGKTWSVKVADVPKP